MGTIPHTTLTALADRSGFSLLEVLVASGILVVGLASVAALLPAAATRMHQAVVQDRAGALAANAYADIMARRGTGILNAKTLNAQKQDATNWKFIVFGSRAIAEALIRQPTLVNVANLQLFTPKDPSKSPASLFIATGRDWDNHDAIQYMPNGGNIPTNIIIGTGPGGAATEREYKPEICWLATIGSTAPSPTAGAPVSLSIAIFKSPDAGCRPYTITGSGVYTVTDPNTSQPPGDDDRRAYLGSCSYVLDANVSPPRWCQITSSWTKTTSNGQTISTSIIVDPPATGTTLLAFEHLVRVDTHLIRLD
jgi:prepilin-type N-terminal cleavage/methylation domain-containing protein